MSGGKLFHTLVAAAANVLSPKLLQLGPVDSERSSVSRTQFSGAYIGDQYSEKKWEITKKIRKEVNKMMTLLSKRIPHLSRTNPALYQ